MKVLVTGGAGFIGSHTVVELLSEQHETLILDNYRNSSPEAVRRVRELSNGRVTAQEADILDTQNLSCIFAEFQPDAVIHFAGLKAVGESTMNPLLYYRQNIEGAISLLEAMDRNGCSDIVFSSSATVYGEPDYLPLDEAHPLRPANPYGKTKYFIEEMLRDWCAADKHKSAIALRYFNPVGAHASGRIGEDPNGIPNNLMPFISQVAVGKRERLKIFGNDYDTHDGTGVRDYIHVVDLARAHVAAVNALVRIDGFEPVNLGTGQGYSVLDVLHAFEKASGRTIAHAFAPRRPGDVAASYADPTRARQLLGWKAELGLDEMCISSWNWQRQNPDGYAGS
ncbi:MAG: UDP-glucose 4-epimerase GalE [Nitratireductor sp.]|nr:UDP-glucose 4-epimerase GalE [Nitratireductor sp.]MCC0019859.1 UDP-glucose 4-epimerase GalE [Nitratireductor sp.]